MIDDDKLKMIQEMPDALLNPNTIQFYNSEKEIMYLYRVKVDQPQSNATKQLSVIASDATAAILMTLKNLNGETANFPAGLHRLMAKDVIEVVRRDKVILP
jgi:ethanolamine utilization protein EutP (predicted NTPase)